MRTAAILLLTLALGCGRSAAPTLTWSGTAIDENLHPTPVVLAITNDGDSTVYVTDVRLEVERKSLIFRGQDRDRLPKRFQSVFGLNSPPVALEPGKKTFVPCVLAWVLPPDPPHILAVVQGTFIVKSDDREIIRNKPLAFVLQPVAGTLEAGKTANDPEQAAAVLKVLRNFDGDKSRGFKELQRQCERVVKPATI